MLFYWYELKSHRVNCVYDVIFLRRKDYAPAALCHCHHKFTSS